MDDKTELLFTIKNELICCKYMNCYELMYLFNKIGISQTDPVIVNVTAL